MRREGGLCFDGGGGVVVWRGVLGYGYLWEGGRDQRIDG